MIGGRKFTLIIVSIVIWTIATAYILISEQTEKASTIVSVATGITMITGAYIAGNVFQKNNEGK